MKDGLAIQHCWADISAAIAFAVSGNIGSAVAVLVGVVHTLAGVAMRPLWVPEPAQEGNGGWPDTQIVGFFDMATELALSFVAAQWHLATRGSVMGEKAEATMQREAVQSSRAILLAYADGRGLTFEHLAASQHDAHCRLRDHVEFYLRALLTPPAGVVAGTEADVPAVAAVSSLCADILTMLGGIAGGWPNAPCLAARVIGALVDICSVEAVLDAPHVSVKAAIEAAKRCPDFAMGVPLRGIRTLGKRFASR